MLGKLFEITDPGLVTDSVGCKVSAKMAVVGSGQSYKNGVGTDSNNIIVTPWWKIPVRYLPSIHTEKSVCIPAVRYIVHHSCLTRCSRFPALLAAYLRLAFISVGCFGTQRL